MTRRLLYATSNPGKVLEMRGLMDEAGIDLLTPDDLDLALDVPETGRTLEENARLKAEAYLAQVDGDTIVMGDDTGLAIEALGGEPGIHVRRWSGQPMTDEAIIRMALDRLDGVPDEQRGAVFRTVIALGRPGKTLRLFEGSLHGVILSEAAPFRIAGFPFESVFYVPSWGMLLGDLYRMSAAEKAAYPTHRDRAIQAALPHIRALLNGA